MSATIITPEKYNVLHIKTTGVFPTRGAKIIEISMLKIEKNVEIAARTILVNPERRIPKKVQQATAITDQLVASAARFAEIASEVSQFFGDEPIVTWSAQFEIERFLRPELQTFGYELPQQLIDLQQLTKTLDADPSVKYDFVSLVQRFELNQSLPARGSDDVQLVWQVFQQLQAEQQLAIQPEAKPLVLDQSELQRVKLLTIPPLNQSLLVILADDPIVTIREQARALLFTNFMTTPEQQQLTRAFMEFVQAKKYKERVLVATMPHLPGHCMEILANDPTVTVRKTLAMHPKLSLKIAEQLLNDSATSVREQALKNPTIPPQLLAKHPEVTVTQLKQLVDHPDQTVREAIVDHEQATSAILAQLIHDSVAEVAIRAQKRMLATGELTTELKVKLLTAIHVTAEVFEICEADQNLAVRKALVSHKQAPLAYILAALQDEHQEVIYVAKQKIRERASHPKTKVHELQILATCDDYTIQQVIASHPQTPPETLAQLAQRSFDNFGELKIGKALAMNHQTPVSVLLKLARIKSLRADVYETLTKKI